jgi:hypothetical protein
LPTAGPASQLQINPLTPELNPFAQRCLTRFFTGDFASSTVYFVNTRNMREKTNKHANYSFSLLFMYGSSYMFRQNIAILSERS